MFAVERISDVKGRGYLAKESIAQGTLIISDVAVLAVPLESPLVEEQAAFCANCFFVIKKSQLQSSRRVCKCSTFYYCSESCEKNLESIHSKYVCPAKYPFLAQLSPEMNLALLSAIRRPTDLEQLQSEGSIATELDKELMSLGLAAQILAEIMDIELADARALLLIWLKRVLINGFGLRLSFLDANAYALGLFGKISLFNHSCAPNCHYYFAGGQSSMKLLTSCEC